MISEEQIAELTRRIVERFDPEQVVLFGSYAYGFPDEYSDVDLLVLLPFEGKSLHMSKRIVDAADPDFEVDLIVRDPDDARRRYEQFDPLIREAFNRGKVLYERSR